MEIEVLEVSRSRFQDLGISFPSQLSVITSTDTAATASVPALTLQALRNFNSGMVKVSPNPALNFQKTVGDTNILANPRIRVRNNDTAKIQVGDKVPTFTTTATANVGISDSVAYVDVGLKLEVTPRITLDDFVNIKVALEVSSIVRTVTSKQGSEAPQVGTRNASTQLRLKDGETQILAGLINDAESSSIKRLPGIGDIPILGRLFGNNTDKRDKTEIVLAITPRILNNINRPQSEIAEYWSGTETRISDRPQIVVPAGGAGGGIDGRRNILRRSLPAEQPANNDPAQVQAPAEPAKENPAPAEAPKPKPFIEPISPPRSF